MPAPGQALALLALLWATKGLSSLTMLLFQQCMICSQYQGCSTNCMLQAPHQHMHVLLSLPAGTLMVFAVVALALIWKRIVRAHAPFSENTKPMVLIALLVSSCIGELLLQQGWISHTADWIKFLLH